MAPSPEKEKRTPLGLVWLVMLAGCLVFWIMAAVLLLIFW